MTRVLKPAIRKSWGVYNYDVLWDVFTNRRDAREYARKQMGIDEPALRKRIASGAISIVKVVTIPRQWKDQWSRTKP